MTLERSGVLIMLKVLSLNKSFDSGLIIKNKVQAVSNVSFQLKSNVTLGLAGNSGCGKTTISKMLLGILKPDSGEIIYNEKNIYNLSKKEMKCYHKDVQCIFQNPEGSMNPSQTVLDNLMEPMILHSIFKTKDERINKIYELLDMVGLSKKLLAHYPHQISGGEAQRLVICRALTLNPKVLILDEPTSMLDVSVQAHIMTLLKNLKKSLDLTYIYISHDIDLHRWFTDELIIMHKGSIVEYGNTQNLLNNPKEEYTKNLLKSFETWT